MIKSLPISMKNEQVLEIWKENFEIFKIEAQWKIGLFRKFCAYDVWIEDFWFLFWFLIPVEDIQFIQQFSHSAEVVLSCLSRISRIGEGVPGAMGAYFLHWRNIKCKNFKLERIQRFLKMTENFTIFWKF